MPVRAVRTLLAIASLAVATATAATPPAGPSAADEYQAAVDLYGRGDVRNALSILRKHADAGHAPSQALLAEILDLAESNEEAVRYYGLAAAQGLPAGLYGMGVMHATGEGLPKKDLKAAREWFLKAAAAGHTLATKAIATAYMEGGLAFTDEDRAAPEARHWIERAAALDSVPAIDRLAVAYRKGELGLAADAKKAEELEARSRTLRREAPPKGKKAKQRG